MPGVAWQRSNYTYLLRIAPHNSDLFWMGIYPKQTCGYYPRRREISTQNRRMLHYQGAHRKTEQVSPWSFTHPSRPYPYLSLLIYLKKTQHILTRSALACIRKHEMIHNSI